MHDQPLNFPDHSAQQIELRISRIPLNDHDNTPLLNDLIADRRELNRRRLVDLYDITLDDFGNYATIGHANQLLKDSLTACQAALNDYDFNRGTGDDGSDYLNALAEQLRYLADLNAEFNDDATEESILKIINITDPDSLWLNPQQHHLNAEAFQYGFADHNSPISDLAAFTYQDN